MEGFRNYADVISELWRPSRFFPPTHQYEMISVNINSVERATVTYSVISELICINFL